MLAVSFDVAAVLPTSPALVAVVILFALVLWFGWSPTERWALRRIPGPWSLPFLGHLPAMMAKDLTYYFHEVSLKYGPVAQVWFGARPWVLVSDPVAIRRIAYKFAARPPNIGTFTHMLTGEARELEAEMGTWNRGAAWKASRRAFESSVMHPERLKGHVPAIRRCIDRFLESHLKRWADSGEAVDLKKAFGVVSLAITGEVAYGVDFWPEDAAAGHADGNGIGGSKPGEIAELMDACRECFECLEMDNASVYLPLQIITPSLQPLWLWLAERLPDAAQRRHMRARQKVAGASRRLIHQWQAAKASANGHSNGNNNCQTNCATNGQEADELADFRETSSGGISSSSFLAAMLEDRKQQQEKQQQEGGAGKGAGTHPETELPRLSDTQIVSQVITFMLAGYDTTSTTLSNLAFCLASHPAVQEKLRSELSAHPGCLDDVDRLGQLPYLDAVLRESQRIYPVVSLLVRDLTTDLDLGGGIVIPRGTIVSPNSYTVQNDPQQWREPDRFLPERFLPETKGALGPADPNAFIPFGIGPRMCVGYKLATLIVKLTAAALLLRYKLELHPRQRLPLRLKTGLTVAPKDGVWVTLSEL